MNSCAVCNAPSTKQCAACLGVFYCSKEHQKQDWKNHKASACLPYKIKEDALLGFYLVAARQLAAGDLVLKQNPLARYEGSVHATASVLEHSCIPNCFKVTESTGEIIVRAAQPIKPGEHLSRCYSDPLLGTLERLEVVKEFNSTCNCIRCLDPTELGTHFSSLKCLNPECSGFLVAPYNYRLSYLPWKCQICHSLGSNVRKFMVHVRAELSSVDKTNFAECQDFINRYEPLLHENHYLLTEVRLYTTTIPYSSFTENDWKVQLKYCRQLDQLLSKFALASYRIRCLNLFRLGIALHEVNGDDSAEEAKQVVDKAFDLLKYDPDLPDIFLGVHQRQQLMMGRRFPMPAAGH